MQAAIVKVYSLFIFLAIIRTLCDFHLLININSLKKMILNPTLQISSNDCYSYTIFKIFFNTKFSKKYSRSYKVGRADGKAFDQPHATVSVRIVHT